MSGESVSEADAVSPEGRWFRPIARSGALALTVLVLLIAAAVPGTSGAFVAKVQNTTDTSVSKGTFTCTDLFRAPKAKATAYFEWVLGEPAGETTAVDSNDAKNPGVYTNDHGVDTGATRPVSACPNDPPLTASTFTGKQFVRTTSMVSVAPLRFSLAIWFRSPQKGGRLIGFSNQLSETQGSGSYDRHIYFQPSGQISFGVYNYGTRIITSPAGTNYADDRWHLAVATFDDSGPSAGMFLYLDGVLADSNTTADYRSAEANLAYWRVGWDAMDPSWTGGTDTSAVLQLSVRFAAAYARVLDGGEVASMWSIGKPAP